MTRFPRIHLRVDLAPGIAIGPGKADLLEGIADTGSIAAAARRMRMSYRRAWLLVEELNASFARPLVLRSRGGAQGGRASLSALGARVLRAYRSMQARTARAASRDVASLSRACR